MATAVEVWDLAAGRAASSPQRYAEHVRVSAVSDDGSLLLAVHGGTSGQVREVTTGEPVGAALPPEGALGQAAFSPRGDRLLLLGGTRGPGRREGRAELWETRSGRRVARLPQRAAGAAEFSPDGTRLATGAGDGTARVWDGASGRPITPPLEHRDGMYAVRFSRDGRQVVTVASSSGAARPWDAATGEPLSPPLGRQGVDAAADGDGRLVTFGVSGRNNRLDLVRVWDVTPDARPLDQLRALAQVLSGSRLDDTGGLVPLDDEEYARAWQAVRESAGPSEETLRRRRLGWHAAEAIRQEQAGRWAAAAEHLGPLIEAQPHRWQLYARRGRALRELRRWEQADADLSAALERGAEDPSVWIDRGHVRAEQGRWQEAADDFARADAAGVVSMPSFQAMALVAAGDLPAVRGVWAKLLQNRGHKGGGWLFERTARAGLLRPEAGLDTGPIITALLKDAADEPKEADFRRTLGLAYLRAGKPEEAVKWLKEAAGLREEFPSAWLLLGMAQYRAKDAGKGRSALVRASKWLAEPGRLDRLGWQERLELRLLREEAEAVLKGGK